MPRNLWRATGIQPEIQYFAEGLWGQIPEPKRLRLLAHSEQKAVVSPMLRKQQAWPWRQRTTCSLERAKHPSLPLETSSWHLPIKTLPQITRYYEPFWWMLPWHMVKWQKVKPLPQTKTRAEQNGEGAKNETISMFDMLPAAFHIPRNYRGFHRKTAQTPHSTGEKPQISSAALWRLLTAAAAMELAMPLIRTFLSPD